MIAKQSIGKSFTGALSYNLKKMNDPDPKQRAELLFTNFASMDKSMIGSELTMMKALNPKLCRNTWHTSLNFAKEENISNEKMKAIAEAYMKRMGFDNNLHIIFRHRDTGHSHCHILALRNRFDGTVVSDSHNYQKSEAIIRELEKEYNLVKVLSSNQSQSKAPDKDELEMILRTGKPSMKLLLQEKVRDALAHSLTMRQFIHNLEKNNVHVLFNQASTGRVSGITYLAPGFKIRGQALGNQFKFGSITKQINYEQNRDGKIISQANSRTRENYDGRNKSVQTKGGLGNRNHQKGDRYHTFLSKSNNEFPKRTIAANRQFPRDHQGTGRFADDYSKGTKADSMDLGYQLPGTGDSHGGTRRILSNLLSDSPIIPEKDNKKKREGKRKFGRGM